MKNGITGSMLAGVKVAEASLAKTELENTVDRLPDDHPLKADLEEQKGLLKGDLGGLPTGHPLRLALDEARARYEEDLAREKVAEEDAETGKEMAVRRAKRLDDREQNRHQRQAREESTERFRSAVRDVNSKIEESAGMLQSLMGVISDNDEALSSDPLVKTRMTRLGRLLLASVRGLADSKMNTRRMS